MPSSYNGKENILLLDTSMGRGPHASKATPLRV